MRALKIIGGFVAGLIIGEAIPIAGYLIAVSYMGVFDRDGGGAMGTIFILGPMAAIVTGIIMAVIVAIRTRAGNTQRSAADQAGESGRS